MPKTLSDAEYRQKHEGKLPRGRWIFGPGEHAEHDGETLMGSGVGIGRRGRRARRARASSVTRIRVRRRARRRAHRRVRG